MASIKILVAEDDPLHAGRLEILLEEMSYEILGPLAEQSEIINVFKATQPDLLLLDIQLKGGSDGIDIATQLNQIRRTPTIFATSFEDTETMKRAWSADPYAYIVKPVERGSLQAAIELALYKFHKENQDSSYKNHYGGWDEDLVIKDSFFIKAGEKLIKLPSDDILWIEVAEDRYCDIISSDRRYHLRTSLASIEAKLDRVKFFRCHRTCIVSLSKIDSINEADFTISVGGKEVPLGKSFKTDLIKRLKTFQ